MQEKIIEHFISLTKIPHCSKDADKLLSFLEDFAKEREYKVQIDETKNILISKGTPKLALQAHYDMVCMGKAPTIETYIEEGWMYAKESSLGSDNGMAIAMMMLLMDRGEALEFVITADEEIGLVGADALAFDVQSDYMLNLDFEDEAEVCIGCAGGADLLATQTFQEVSPLKYNYRVSVSDLKGGHSGVDIDKGIPNAIKELASYLEGKDVVLSSFNGGERRNSIPANAVALLSSKEELESTEMVYVEKLEEPLSVYESGKFLELLNRFEHGVNSYNDEFDLPDTSVNLAIVSFKEGKVIVESSARAMSAEGLDEICSKNLTLFSELGFEGSDEYKYPSWKPEVNEFSKEVGESMKKVFGHSEYKAIHAGLECGLISEKYSHMKFASIGPTIMYPHSTREKIKLDSIAKTFEVVEDIVSKL
ncbi:MAG: M20/M25/M40 family metallo-hydrolase [Epsilonproteobacteria bacterium]|nr:M20/M25/M40 family metallo-hydrolase [Campylobacterota bacterium]